MEISKQTKKFNERMADALGVVTVASYVTAIGAYMQRQPDMAKVLIEFGLQAVAIAIISGLLSYRKTV